MVTHRRNRASRSASRTPRSGLKSSRKPRGSDAKTTLAAITHELSEAREQQNATAEILRVIRGSPADVQPVFETIVRSTVSLCGSLYANVFRFDGELLHFVASHNGGVRRKNWLHNLELIKTKYPMRPDSSQVVGRVVLTKSVVRLDDALVDPDYDQRLRGAIGFRRLLGVPMLRGGEPLGVIVALWAEAGPVPKVQEKLLKTFADQAVIAIENARLLRELRERTTELTESLEQQTATSEVLQVIASSPGELEPVFQAMLANATRLCDASYGAMWLSEGDLFRNAAFYGPLPAAYMEQWQSATVSVTAPLGRVAQSRKPLQIADLRQDQTYHDGHPLTLTAVHIAQYPHIGYRTHAQG